MKYSTINLLLIFLVTGCEIWSFEDKPGNWEYITDFPGPGRGQAVSFVIDDIAYIGLGSARERDSNYSDYISLIDFWKFDPATITWTRLSDFPLNRVPGAMGFSINHKGYVIYYKYTGNEIWEYDPVEDSWQQLTGFPGFSRTGAICFTLNNKGYFGLGSARDTIKNEVIGATDLWEYDPGSDIWSQKATFPGIPRESAVTFTINNKAFVCTGREINTLYTRTLRDTWEYEPGTDTWSRKTDFGGYARFNATAFSNSDKAYLGVGEVVFGAGTSSGIYMCAADFWEYDYLNDSWKQIENFPGHLYGGTAFEINDNCYMGLGDYDWNEYNKEIYQLKIVN